MQNANDNREVIDLLSSDSDNEVLDDGKNNNNNDNNNKNNKNNIDTCNNFNNKSNDNEDNDNKIKKNNENNGKNNGLMFAFNYLTSPLKRAKKNHEQAHQQQQKRCQNSAASTIASNLEFPAMVLDENDNGILTCDILSAVQIWSTNNAVSCLPKSNMSNCDGTTTIPSTLQHLQQNDRWSCGFRNLQMMLTAIVPHLSATHEYIVNDNNNSVMNNNDNIMSSRQTVIPSVYTLQMWMEESWKQGYDPRGAKHYNYNIIGRPSKVGAVEVCSLLSFLGFDATTVQFISCDESRSQLSTFVYYYFSKQFPKDYCPFCSRNNKDNVTNIKNDINNDYSDGDSNTVLLAKHLFEKVSATIREQQQQQHLPQTAICNCNCPLPPIYLQWEGHSVTIVGAEMTSNHKKTKNNDIRLLVFDPMRSATKMKKDLQRSLEPLRLPPKKLIQKDIQIILCSLQSLSAKDKLKRKSKVSALTAAKEAVLKVSNNDKIR